MKRCDIVVPVYNAYEALIECLETVIKNTNLLENGLIIINDKSTDQRISLYLLDFKSKHKDLNIEILENSTNLGFVKTVNKGMKYSNNDVLLLNSDTEVPENWLENIKKTAYSAPKIATVTTLSNNATLTSVPVAFEKNSLPGDMTFQEYASLVSKCAYKKIVELPTAHGFCMYIKRDALDEIGYFDEAFGKGYGEENDFSFRALERGYRNVLCDNVIVLHKESQSFSDTKKKLIEEHNKILKSKYLFYETKLEEWCMNNPISYIGTNISYNVLLKKRPNILVIIHDFDSLVGGTTLHVRDIINGLKDKFNFHVLGFSEGGYKLYSILEDNEYITPLKTISKNALLPRYNEEYKEMVSNIVEIFGISGIHIHHMMNHYFDLIDIKKKYNLKMIVTLHDFYAICPTINMMYNNTYCGSLKDKNCSICLKNNLNLSTNILDSWHEDFKRLFLSSNLVIVPSEDTKNKINHVYDTKLTVIEHGVDLVKSDYVPDINDNKLNVAYIGALSVNKGLYVFEDLIKATKNKNITYHLFGISAYDRLHKNKKNFINHGKYKREDIPKLLKENNIDLVCFFQIWPETYSYTVSEAINANVPIITYDIGAGAYRVKENKLGWNIEVGSDSKKIIEELNKVLLNKEEYNQVVNNIKNYNLKSIKEMLKEYENIYKDFEYRDVDYQEIANILKDNCNDSNLAKGKLELILNSTRWKLINKINFSSTTTNFIRKLIKVVKK